MDKTRFSNSKKQMLITVGTTKFESLIKNIDTEEFYMLLDNKNFTKLIIQKGTGEYFPNKFLSETIKFKNLSVEVYDILPNFEDIIKNSDYIISHGGAGNVLESLKHRKKLFVAVNNLLMDNHQVELAEALEKENYVFYIKNLSEIKLEVENVLNLEETNFKLLNEYPDFNLDVVPNLIYRMLDI